jgi:hypothetical protein
VNAYLLHSDVILQIQARWTTRWILLLEEYGPKYVHIAGEKNVVADALSRLKTDEDENLSEKEEG